MDTTTCLQDSIKHTQDELAEQFVTARTVMPERGHSRRGCQCVDLYLVGSSRHLHAVDEVLDGTGHAYQDSIDADLAASAR